MSRSKARRAAARKRQQQNTVRPETANDTRPTSPRKATVEQETVAEQEQAVITVRNREAVAAASGTRAPVAEKPNGPDKPTRKVVTLGHQSFTITDETYASVAESLMERGEKRGFWGLTTTKLRSIYALIMNISVRAGTPEAFDAAKPDIQYLKVRMAYEAGREGSVRTFLSESNLMNLVGAIADFDQFKLYCRYAEALVAYFKYFGGRDS